MKLPAQSQQKWQQLENRLSYKFSDRSLLAAAMTHSSYANETQAKGKTDYERLEFLGDAVLDLIISEYMMSEFSGLGEGGLSRMRADVVAAPSLANVARSLDIGRYLLLGRGEERSGGRDKPSLLADALEAVVGAIFTDGGYDSAKTVALPLFIPLLKQAALDDGQDYKSRLQELLQGSQRPLPNYTLLGSQGPPHERIYDVEVLVDDDLRAIGHGRTKKSAEQDAARAVLAVLTGDT